jgi:lysophospholipase L1-like esterase
MKAILCYGDSNTWGYAPGTGARHPLDTRWPGVLQRQLGNKAHVIEEGLNGRSTVLDEPFRAGRNGATLLPILLESHAPVDILVLMLGSNDVLHYSEVTAHDAARGVSMLIDLARIAYARLELKPPEVLLVSPPHALELSDEMKKYCQGTSTKTKEFAEHYREVADNQRCEFLDASGVVSPSEIDGIHLDAEGHKKLGLAIARSVDRIIGKEI